MTEQPLGSHAAELKRLANEYAIAYSKLTNIQAEPHHDRRITAAFDEAQKALNRFMLFVAELDLDNHGNGR